MSPPTLSVSLPALKQTVKLEEGRNSNKDLKMKLLDLQQQVSTKNDVLEAKKDYIIDLQDEIERTEKVLKRTLEALTRKTEISDIQENKVIVLTEVIATLEIEKTQAKAKEGETQAKLKEANVQLGVVTTKLDQKSRQILGIQKDIKDKAAVIIKLKKHKESQAHGVPQNVGVLNVIDEIHIEKMQCTSKEKVEFSEEADKEVDKEVTKHQAILVQGTNTNKRKRAPEFDVGPLPEKKRRTSSCFLRMVGRECSAQGQGGRRLSALAGLPVYTRERIPGGGIIHDVVAGVRLVTEGAKADRVFAVRAPTRKGGLRVIRPGKVAEIVDSEFLADSRAWF